jgi:hypothetical protein
MSKNEETIDLKGLDSVPEKRQVPPELLTPAGMAAMNQNTAEMVREIFAQLAPMLKDISLSPEKLALMEQLRRAPSEDQEKAAARNKRERKLMQDEQNENARNLALSQANCLHKYKTGGTAINLVHNTFDGRPRGVCVLCGVWIHGKEWRVSNPTVENPRGELYVADAHPLVHLLKEAMMQKN